MKYPDMDRSAPRILRIAAMLLSIGCATYGVALAVLAFRTGRWLDVFNVAITFLVAVKIPSFVTRLQPWGYWLNVVLLLPLLVAGVAFLLFAEARWGAPMMTWPTDGILWMSVLTVALGSALLAAPASKTAALHRC